MLHVSSSLSLSRVCHDTVRMTVTVGHPTHWPVDTAVAVVVAVAMTVG